jgi:predicted kinase
MIKCILTKGCPASGKSTWAKAEIAKDPSNWVRINNDDLRNMTNGAVFSLEYEKLITDMRKFLIREAFKRGKNVIIDNVNANKRHWEDTCKLAQEANRDIQVFEKAFYVPLDELVERDSKREGNAKVGENVVKKFFKDLGKDQFKFYKPKMEVFQKRDHFVENLFVAASQNVSLPSAIICDLDGTLAILNGRSPYDATDCDIKDLPNLPVIETVLAHYKAGRKILFCSGREDKYFFETVKFIEKHLKDIDSDGKIWDVDYNLFMRRSGDFRKDSIIKEEIYDNHIKNKYNVLLVLDDRTSVVNLWREKLGLTCFQVAPGDF